MIASPTASNAQYIEDATRFTRPNGVLNARSAALGISYLGVIDDVAAMNYNPAGLTLLPKTEFSIGMNFLMNNNETSGFDQLLRKKSNKENFNNISVASPFIFGSQHDKRGAIGLSYHLENSFYQNYDSEWFNDRSSMVGYLAENQPEIAYHLWLSPESNKHLCPVTDSLTQTSSVMQSGGVHNVTGAAAFEINPNFSIGFSITGKWGSYKYDRIYDEVDTYNKYDVFNEDYSQLDFNRLRVYEGIDNDISGISGAFGIMGKVGHNIRLSASIKFPTYYEITEHYNLRVENYWDDGSYPNPYTAPEGSVTYNLHTPFAYNAGVSFYAAGLVFTTGIEYTDASQVEFSDASFSNDPEDQTISQMNIDAVNRLIVSELVGQVTWGFGAEYSFPLIPISLRASYTSTTSPYEDDVTGADKKVIAVGAGVSVTPGVRIDAAARFSKYTEFRTLYGNDINSRYTIDSKPTDIIINLTVRF